VRRLRPATREALTAYLPASAWLVAAVGVGAAHPLRFPLFAAMALGGIALWEAAREQQRFSLPLIHLAAGAVSGVLAATLTTGTLRWWPGLAGLVSLAAVAVHFRGLLRRIAILDEERRALARQVDRRINEIFSLQELSYVLAESLQSERIAGQVARYVMRFLNVEGAAVALPEGGPDGGLLIAAAEGSLASSQGMRIAADSPSLLLRASSTERIEVISGNEIEPISLLPGFRVQTGAAAPLRAHGLTMGVLAVADRRHGSFSAEDLWLLSTVATHVAVVMANSRLFEMVRQAKEEWETAFNALAEGIAVLDGAGRVSRANQGLARLLDRPQTALLGQPFWAAAVGNLDGEDRLIGSARRGDRIVPLTIRSLTIDRVLRLTAAPLGEPAADASVVVLVEDVTEQRALEAQLIQSEKLAAVGQLVSGVAHELNNPLTSIAGLSEFLQERQGLPEDDREHLRVIQEQADRAGRIVRNLLTFARKGTPGAEIVDLNDIVGRTALLVAYELHLRDIELTEERVNSPLPVQGNRDELQQVLLNLVNNAVHAVRGLSGGTPRRVTLRTALEQGQAVVRILDSGLGVPGDLVPQLFTPFFTTKDPGEGTGLGLSLSYRIIESHGGRLAYLPVAGGGAEFWFSLPIHEETNRVVSTAVHPAAVTEERAALLVDSDPGSELVVRALFEPAGYTVVLARTGAEGMERLGTRRWSVVILDGSMSADGRRLLVEVLAKEPGPKVLVTTSDEAFADRCRGLGFLVLPRPFLPRDLVAVAGNLLVP
jgi:signal transduction histidine kinase/CheY-like chemotaxis protein